MEIKPTVDSKETAVTPEVAPSATTITDDEARIAQLEKEKANLVAEAANYKLAFLKEKSKRELEAPIEQDEETYMVAEHAAKKVLAESRLAAIALEQDAIIKKALKENKELKLANANKATTPPQAIGTHSEGIKSLDTTITPEQLAAFKAKGWSDKDIERYKKNLARYSR